MTREGQLISRKTMTLRNDDVGRETTLVTITAKTYTDARVVAFIDFLQRTVVEDQAGKLSSKSIWNTWAGRSTETAIDRKEEVDGIRFHDVQELFTAVYNPGVRVRRRLDGQVQYVWLGYKMRVGSNTSTEEILTCE